MRALFESRHGSSPSVAVSGSAPRRRRVARTRGGQGTLRLSAALAAPARRCTAGLHWRVFNAHAGRGRPHPLDRRIERSPSRPSPCRPATMSSMSPSASPARPSGSRSARSPRRANCPLSGGRAAIAGTQRRHADRPADCRSPSTCPSATIRKAKLVYSKAKAGDLIGLPEGAYHIVSTYLDTSASVRLGGAKSGGAPAQRGPPPIRSSPPTSRSPSGKMIDVTLAPPLRDADAQARQRAGRRCARQLHLHRADAGRRPHSRTDRRLSLAGRSPRANTSSSRATTQRPISRPSRCNRVWTATWKWLHKSGDEPARPARARTRRLGGLRRHADVLRPDQMRARAHL